MKPFESFLAPQFEAYLLYRHKLGYHVTSSGSYLHTFDRYLIETKANPDILLEPAFFLKLRGDLKLQPHTINQILAALRGLFAFLVRQGTVKENPLLDIPPVPERLFIPFVFSPEQVEQLLSSLCNQVRKTEKYFLTDLAVYSVVVLLARCGMRISEPLRMLRTHYCPKEGTLYIEKTKFNKDRLIPAPVATCRAIDHYLAARHALLDKDQNPYLFLGRGNKRLTDSKINRVFKRTVKDIGLDHPRRIAGNMAFGAPSPHCLRHSFAINTLKRIRQAGKDPQHALPVLAAYMGHREYKYTAAYLKVIDANQRQGLIEFAKAFRLRS